MTSLLLNQVSEKLKLSLYIQRDFILSGVQQNMFLMVLQKLLYNLLCTWLFIGYARFPPEFFRLGNIKTIEFGFRTQMHTGIIFFAYGGKGIYVYCALINGALHFEFANSLLVGSVTFNRQDTILCDSRWYDVTLKKDGQYAEITIKDVGTEVSGDANVLLNVLTVSDFFVGGIPPGSEAYQYVIDNKLSMPLSGRLQYFVLKCI